MSIYDRGTVTEIAQGAQSDKLKAREYDRLVEKDRMKSAFTQGADVATAEADDVIRGLAQQLGALDNQLAVQRQVKPGLADSQLKGF